MPFRWLPIESTSKNVLLNDLLTTEYHSSNTLSALCGDEPLSRICRCAKTSREGESENTYTK